VFVLLILFVLFVFIQLYLFYLSGYRVLIGPNLELSWV